MNSYAQEYRLADLRSTTGWRTAMDLNVRDRLSMHPAEVAIQAGNFAEFIGITSHPEFRRESLGHAELHMQWGLRAAIDPYPEAEMRSAVAAVASALRPRVTRGAVNIL